MTDNPAATPEPKTYRQMLHELWSRVDWSKTNIDLACELEVTQGTVSKWRMIITHKVPAINPSKKYNIDWNSLDWAENDTTLAKQLHIPYADVRRARIKLKKPYPSKDSYNRKVDPEKLAQVDWEFTRDIDIGRHLGVSRERVRQLRNDLQKPECLVAGMGLNRIECFKWIVKNKSTLEGLSRREISDLFYKEYQSLLTRGEVYNVIKRTGIRFKLERNNSSLRESIFKQVNFNLPNIVLVMIYGMPNYSFATARDRYFKGKAEWHLGGYSKLINDEGFITALEAEKAKAMALGLKVDSERINKWLQWKRDYQHPHTTANKKGQA